MPVSRLRSLVVLPFVLVGLLALSTPSTASAPPAAGHRAAATQSSAQLRAARIDRAVSVAVRQIGDRYRYGAAGPRAFDCSGLLNYSFRKAGFRKVPRTSDAQARWGHRVKKSHLRRGDLMFFHDGGNVYHAAIFLHRTKRGAVVMLDSQRPGTSVHRRHPWTKAWFGRSLRR
ncbi:C40 family peptidase [Nocardioides sp.]|uniref:C40 family peptidase n=1 Tax=Nocardioides sp. TaxID=35761 RepID=UPI003D0C4DD5